MREDGLPVLGLWEAPLPWRASVAPGGAGDEQEGWTDGRGAAASLAGLGASSLWGEEGRHGRR